LDEGNGRLIWHGKTGVYGAEIVELEALKVRVQATDRYPMQQGGSSKDKFGCGVCLSFCWRVALDALLYSQRARDRWRSHGPRDSRSIT